MFPGVQAFAMPASVKRILAHRFGGIEHASDADGVRATDAAANLFIVGLLLLQTRGRRCSSVGILVLCSARGCEGRENGCLATHNPSRQERVVQIGFMIVD